MFGDILSDMTAGLIGGMGMAPSEPISAKHHGRVPAVPRHAPDIMGQGKANPTGMIFPPLCADWLADSTVLKGDRACEASIARSTRLCGRHTKPNV